MDMPELLFVILAGAFGGLVRSVLGWAQQDKPEAFDWQKFLKSVVRATIGGAVFAYGLGLEPIATFFAAIGIDVLAHDAWKSLKVKK
jgi:fluoride ion exporter CrcB/FEX